MKELAEEEKKQLELGEKISPETQKKLNKAQQELKNFLDQDQDV